MSAYKRDDTATALLYAPIRTARDDPHPLLSLSVAVRFSDATAVRTRQQRYDAMKVTDSDQLHAMGTAARQFNAQGCRHHGPTVFSSRTEGEQQGLRADVSVVKGRSSILGHLLDRNDS
jgi:hypothetical protein